MSESPLISGARKTYEQFSRAVSSIPTPGYRKTERKGGGADAGMVREANQSFRDKAARESKRKISHYKGRDFKEMARKDEKPIPRMKRKSSRRSSGR